MIAASQIIPRGFVVTEELLLIRNALLDRIAAELPEDASDVSPVTYIEETEEGLRLTVEVVWV